MIVDDRHFIIGSANWNDRSMMGSRDCETAVLVTQPDKNDKRTVQLGSGEFEVSTAAHEFRTELMMEHWDRKYEEIANPF